ncbi:MAG: trypsin-like peptidase domain-containing protein, partial [Phaeodactylibacter sp.]|nr:trypsin-like peptidase domain-containing protein [Phaeodactylibacter sp.]
SGVIIAKDGYIITNHHVIEDGATYEITMYDKRKLEAELIGSDPTTDLALLKVDARGLKPVLYGDSDQVEVGQWVLAVGNPFNLSSTVTAGIVSAKARNINILRGSYSIESFIQTDAVVNPGNSGGALVNERGELIGINTAIISESGGYEGYSFAIPSNLVRKVVRDIREFGEVQRAILGVGIAEVNGEIAGQQSLPGVAGVYINNVSRGSSAAEAGLREGDVLISINSIKTNSVPELQEQIALFRPGDKISLEFYRDGQKFRRDNVVLQSLDESGR